MVRRFKGPSDIADLVASARSEGFEFLDRLVREWEDGTNRFDSPGEVLYVATLDDRTIGMAGLSLQREGLGRVRRVYVHPEFRQKGLGGRLIRHIVDRSRGIFGELVLFTDQEGAKRLYERLGFQPESPEGPDHATHRLLLSSAETS